VPWSLLLGLLSGLAATYLALLVALFVSYRRHPEALRVRDALRLLPDVLRLLRGVAGDADVPWRVRALMVLLLAYLASPIDLVPDVVPVLGYADDVLVVALALRAASRAAGAGALGRHWPGTPEGFTAVCRLAGLTDS
jgi:uncharacterized membrane protein YkvA (DUF1232 family)